MISEAVYACVHKLVTFFDLLSENGIIMLCSMLLCCKLVCTRVLCISILFQAVFEFSIN